MLTGKTALSEIVSALGDYGIHNLSLDRTAGVIKGVLVQVAPPKKALPGEDTSRLAVNSKGEIIRDADFGQLLRCEFEFRGGLVEIMLQDEKIHDDLTASLGMNPKALDAKALKAEKAETKKA